MEVELLVSALAFDFFFFFQIIQFGVSPKNIHTHTHNESLKRQAIYIVLFYNPQKHNHKDMMSVLFWCCEKIVEMEIGKCLLYY